MGKDKGGGAGAGAGESSGGFWQDGKECRRLAAPQRAAALHPALLHTSLADMPSQALFTRGCALLGNLAENKE